MGSQSTTDILTTSDLKHLLDQLGATISGDIHLNDDRNFYDYSLVFNGNVITRAKAVICPKNAEDVSKILIFCTKYSLSPSIKAGGYGTAGWAIAGDVIIDLSKLTGVEIEPPLEDGSFTSLRDMPFFDDKGKGKVVVNSSISSGKRRREDDAQLRIYDSASKAVSDFLRGGGAPSPAIRRRLNDTFPSQLSSSASGPSPNSATSDDDASSPQSGTSTIGTSPSPTTDRRSNYASPFGGDPFGYMSDNQSKIPPMPPIVMPPAVTRPDIGNMMMAPGQGLSLVNASLPPVSNSLMAYAEPIYPHAYVTFGAGMRQKEIDAYSAKNPLEARSLALGTSKIPYHVPFSAHPVGSSIMLLGGFGFLSRLYGLSIDNLVEVEMVLADGRIVIVNNDEYPDLWWALRGAGSAFGVATRYKARAYPIPVVFAGNLIYRFSAATAPSLIKHFRDCVKGAPRELYANVILTAGPEGKDSLVVIQMCYAGPKEKGQEFLNAVSSWNGESSLLNEVDEKSFLHQQDSVAQVLRGKAGNQWFIRSAMITSLPDDIINDTVMSFAGSPIGCTWLFELAGGAIESFEDTCFPKEKRAATFTVAALHQWPMGVVDPRCETAAEEWISGTLGPVSTGNPLPCFLGRHESAARTMACFGDNWDRLCEIKKRYDPNGLFRNSIWPLGPEGEVCEPHIHEPPTPGK